MDDAGRGRGGVADGGGASAGSNVVPEDGADSDPVEIAPRDRDGPSIRGRRRAARASPPAAA